MTQDTNAPSPSAGLLASLPQAPLGLPLIGWISCAIFAVIFLIVISAYL